LKLHKVLCEAVISGLHDILISNLHAHHTVEKLLQSNKKWGARDRHFIADYIYEIVRYKRLYAFACNQEELIFKVQLWDLLAACFIQKEIALPAWEEFQFIDTAAVSARLAEGKLIRKIRESVPDWLDVMGEKSFGEKWDAEIHALNQPAKLCVRVNTLRSNKKRIKELFLKEDIAFEERNDAPDALVLNSRKNLTKTEIYKDGEIEIQDISSQLVAPYLDAKPGMIVIDACAGAGGKSLHLAALMKNEGEILALDIHHEKLNELEKRARRNGVNIIKTVFFNADVFKRYHHFADRLLLDVPCSGSGVLKRNPDAKWKLTPDFIKEICAVQESILQQNEGMLKPGGKMVYATCSILAEENGNQIARFLKKHKNFSVVEEHKISPAENGYDGFYVCVLQKSL
jgi:16S rRNA (cytosine967-C5)-methyltransferase